MAKASYSKHVPDFRLITNYAETGRSFAHRMNPWTKAALLVTVVLLVIVVKDIYVLFVLYGVTVSFYAASRLSLRLLTGWYSLPVFFVVTLSITFMFTEPGDQIISVHLGGTHVALTDNGVLLLVQLLVRALAAVTMSLAFFMTTKYSDIAQIASKILPRTLASMFLLSYRFTFETSDEVSDVIDAMRSRSGGLVRSLTRQSKTFAGIVGLSFIHAFERGERIAKAMEARGFSGRFPMAEKIPSLKTRDYAVIALAFLAFALAAYSRYFNSKLIGW